MDATHNCICVLLVFEILREMPIWSPSECTDATHICFCVLLLYVFLYLVHLFLKSWREIERDATLRSIRPHRCHSGSRTTRHNWSMKSILADQEKYIQMPSHVRRADKQKTKKYMEMFHVSTCALTTFMWQPLKDFACICIFPCFPCMDQVCFHCSYLNFSLAIICSDQGALIVFFASICIFPLFVFVFIQ